MTLDLIISDVMIVVRLALIVVFALVVAGKNTDKKQDIKTEIQGFLDQHRELFTSYEHRIMSKLVASKDQNFIEVYNQHAPAASSDPDSVAKAMKGLVMSVFDPAADLVKAGAGVRLVYAARIRALYSSHNPDKVSGVDKLLDRSWSKEHELYERICVKYSVQPHQKYNQIIDPKATENTAETFEKIAALPRDEQTAEVRKLADALRSQPDRLKDAMNDPSMMMDMKHFTDFQKMEEEYPEQYKKVMESLPGHQRVMLEVFTAVVARNKDGTPAVKSHKEPSAESPIAKKKEELSESAKQRVKKLMEPLEGAQKKGFIDAEPNDVLFSVVKKLDKLPKPEQDEGIDYIVKFMLTNRQAGLTVVEEAMREPSFKELLDLKKTNPEQFDEMIKHLPDGNGIMAQVICKLHVALEKLQKKVDKKVEKMQASPKKGPHTEL